MLDPDFGWHLKLGELFLTKGFLYQDAFSYTMPGFPYIVHEWFTAVAIAYLVRFISYNGVAILFAGIATFAVLISIPKYSKYYIIPVFLSIPVLVVYIGIRPQIVSWLFFALILRILLNRTLYIKLRFLLPILFLAWANMHGAFAGGLAGFATVLFFRRTGIKIFLLSVAATLINPYGFNLWKVAWDTVSSPLLNKAVAEWQPKIFEIDIAFLALIALSAVLLIRFRSWFGREHIALYIFFLLMALLGTRHVPLWTFIAIGIISEGLERFAQSLRNIPYALERFNKVYRIAVVSVLFLTVLLTISSLDGAYKWSESKNYPKGGVDFLLQISRQGEVFTEYGWGGYVIWRLDKKTFVDGRMPIWNYKTPPEGELKYAFETYLDILGQKKDYKPVFDKYNIRTVLWPTPKLSTYYTFFNLKIEKPEFIKKRFPKEPKDPFLTMLEKDGWKKVYQDEVAIILIKPDNR